MRSGCYSTLSMLATLGTLLIQGCASSALRVESTPEGADILVAREGSPAVRVGKTPMTLTAEAVPDLFSENFKVTLIKDSYQAESLFVPKSSVGASGHWLSALKAASGENKGPVKEIREVKDARDVTDSINAIARGVAEAQQRFFQKNYQSAQRVLEELADKYPNIAVIYDLLGNVYYVQKDSARALTAYKRSYELMPNSIETARMIEKLSKIQGVHKGGDR